MHVPDHLLDPAVSLTTATVAATSIAVAAWRAGGERSRRDLAFGAAVTAFVFAAQMVNYAVLPGTSGHLMGAALAAALLGPWRGILSVTIVLIVQCLVFADGGLTALGTNVVLMALLGVGCTAAVMGLVDRVAGRPSPLLGAGLGALISVPAAALVFCGLYLLGGGAAVPAGDFLGSMIGVHALIGVGEAVISVSVLSFVMALAPGLAAADERAFVGSAQPRGVLGLVGAGLVCAAVLSGVASSAPDGLESVAMAYSFVDTSGTHPFAGGVLAGYGESTGWQIAAVGVLGWALTGALAWLLPMALRSSRSRVATCPA